MKKKPKPKINHPMTTTPKHQTNDQPIYVEDKNELHNEIDLSKVYELPTIKTRYISTFIDLLIIFLASFGLAELFDAIGEVADYLRALGFALIVVMYEPILVTFGCTIGQLIMSIRVRRFKNPEKKITIIAALQRIVMKALLGWISFIMIIFNRHKRAIHDYVSGSIVIIPKDFNN